MTTRVLVIGSGGRENALAWGLARSSFVDEVVCARHPEPFRAVHQGYRDFSQTQDREVLDLLAARAQTSNATHSAAVPSSRQPGTVSNPSTVNRRSEGR